jgi:hypothetical protein
MLWFGDFCYVWIFKKVHSISGRSLSKLTGAKFFFMQLVSKVSFFYSADLRTRCARAANFLLVKKSITLLTIFTFMFY